MAQALCEVSRGCIGFVTDPANSSCSFRAEISFTECGSVSGDPQWPSRRTRVRWVSSFSLRRLPCCDNIGGDSNGKESQAEGQGRVQAQVQLRTPAPAPTSNWFGIAGTAEGKRPITPRYKAYMARNVPCGPQPFPYVPPSSAVRRNSLKPSRRAAGRGTAPLRAEGCLRRTGQRPDWRERSTERTVARFAAALGPQFTSMDDCAALCDNDPACAGFVMPRLPLASELSSELCAMPPPSPAPTRACPRMCPRR